MLVKLGDRFKAGEKCQLSGVYHFDGYIDGSHYPRPKINESIINLHEGQTFPDIKSLKRLCIWELISKNIISTEK